MIEITTFGSSSAGNAYRITDGNTPLLLEAGIKFPDLRRALDFRVSELAGCLITHEHGDHIKAAADLARAGVDIYASQGTLEAAGLTGHRAHPIQAMQQFTLGTWTILPFDVRHDVAEPLGFLLASPAGKLLFATDTYYIPYRFKGLTHIMVECNYSEQILNDNIAAGLITVGMKRRLIRSHFSLENVKSFFGANDLSAVEEIWLLHLSDNNSDAAAFKREIQEITGKLVRIAER